MKSMITRGVAASCAVAALFAAGSAEARFRNGPKYVFFFVGDGMASVQIQAAEAYKTHMNGDNPDNPADLMKTENRLNMSQLPIAGVSTTFADTQFITDSAAAATAFCCGIKTAPGVIGRNTDLDTSYLSIAEVAQEKGKAIGIISSVSLPHATPAGCYARVNSRNSYTEIGYQASLSGFEFFGGGCFRKLDKTDNAGGIAVSNAFSNAGYVTVNTVEDALAQPQEQKVICSVPVSYGSDAMPYAIDNPEENFSLAEVTGCAIERLKCDRDGFFIFVEGGKIDWAGHANDAKANILDTLAFDEAVGVAMDFMKKHPWETLIAVTGDHETGGMTLGYAGTKYQTAFEVLDGQLVSYELMTGGMYQYKAADSNYVDASSDIDAGMIELIESLSGMVWSDEEWTKDSPANYLSDYQKSLLEEAFDRFMGGSKGNQTITGYDLQGPTTIDYENYGGSYNPIVMTLTHIINQEAGLGWTSYSHTCVPVPVMAVGLEGWRFTGSYDNTDIAKRLAKAMRARSLPAVDKDYDGELNY
ncbi:Alkaline phosphatase 4 [Pontiella desulfatans]|uniref:Alkaline phosphatase 4 n=1 Tax=Pontiella desulfatans TaxID=2750659 RepID=A0A6C2UCM7_PONDE|nr:alkaline phosphatase [Pontiella desulfatans]VGO17124.1 Alkaline phosphatase 4 [Pontiella desulfatans]